MKHFLLVFYLLLIFPHGINPENYYISTDGSDKNPGTIEKPWKTLDMVNKKMNFFKPGDRILFHRGEVFYGELIITCSGKEQQPLLFAAYGEGARPIIKGTLEISQWSKDKDHRWTAKAAKRYFPLPGLILNSRFQALARHPDADAEKSGYMPIQKHTGNRRIVSESLKNLPAIKGCEAVIRSHYWILDRAEVTRHHANIIDVKNDSPYEFMDGFGFFLQNHPVFLSRNGEWCYEKNKSRIRLYWDSDLLKETVEIPVIDTLLTIEGQACLEIRDLSFYGSRISSAKISRSRDILFQNNRIINSARDGLFIENSSRISIIKNIIEHSQDVGIKTGNLEHCDFAENEIGSTAVVPGMGMSKDGHYFGVLLYGDHLTFHFNKIIHTGYIPVNFNGNYIAVHHNVIDHYSFVKNDAGGIYTWSDGTEYQDRVISYNIITGGVGITDGTTYPDNRLIAGIYIDDRQNNVDIHHNSITGIPGDGIKLHNSRKVNIHENTIVNNSIQIGMYHDSIAENHPVTGCTVKNNILFSAQADQLLIHHQSIKNDLNQFALYGGNHYISLFPKTGHITMQRSSSGSSQVQLLNEEDWKKTDPAGVWTIYERLKFSLPGSDKYYQCRGGGTSQ